MKKQTRKEKLDAEKHHHQKLRTDPEYREHHAMLAAYAKAHPLAEKEKKLDENTRLGYSMAEVAYEAGWRASKSYVDIPRGRGHKMAPYTLEGDCITSHILKTQNMREQTHSYFSRSPFWKSLVKHITRMTRYEEDGEKKDNDFLIDFPATEAEVRCWVKGYKSRWGITFLSASIYGLIEAGADNSTRLVSISFEVEWEIDQEDFPKRYDLRVPFDLLDNYTDDKYDAWSVETIAAKTAEKTEKERTLLSKLMERYPELTKEKSGQA